MKLKILLALVLAATSAFAITMEGKVICQGEDITLCYDSGGNSMMEGTAVGVNETALAVQLPSGQTYFALKGYTFTATGSSDEGDCTASLQYVTYIGDGCANTTLVYEFTPAENPEPEPEPEPTPATERYTGYHHICKVIHVDKSSKVDVEFKFEPYNDSYLRYLMYSYDCPENQNKRRYTSSGCSQEGCTDGKFCNMGTVGSRFTKTISFDFEAGDHLVCAWPSSIKGYLWDAEMNVVEITPYEDEVTGIVRTDSLDGVSVEIANSDGWVVLYITKTTEGSAGITGIFLGTGSQVTNCNNNIGAETPCWTGQSGETISELCSNIPFEAGKNYTVILTTASETRNYQVETPKEPESVSDEPESEFSCDALSEQACLAESECQWSTCGCVYGNTLCDKPDCEDLGEEECTSSEYDEYCKWTDGCGCMYEFQECSTIPAEETFECPEGCECDGETITCLTTDTIHEIVPVQAELVGSATQTESAPTHSVQEQVVCMSGCLFKDRCISQGTRIETNDSVSYCDIDGQWKLQKAVGDACLNNFECRTNMCSNGKCYDIESEVRKTQGILQWIMDLITRIFGISIENPESTSPAPSETPSSGGGGSSHFVE